jgi:hypothetical protein
MDEDLKRVAGLIEALQKAERWFRGYEKTHRDKGTPDGRLKANINLYRAEAMAKAVAKAGDVTMVSPSFFVMEEALRAIANEYPPDGDGPEQGPAHLWAWAQARAAAAITPSPSRRT